MEVTAGQQLRDVLKKLTVLKENQDKLRNKIERE